MYIETVIKKCLVKSVRFTYTNYQFYLIKQKFIRKKSNTLFQ